MFYLCLFIHSLYQNQDEQSIIVEDCLFVELLKIPDKLKSLILINK